MNINDLPPELFELILHDIYHPHMSIINTNYKINKLFTDMELYKKNKYNDIYYIFKTNIVENICANNNKLLLMFYKHNDKTMLYTTFHYDVCYLCVKYNHLNTLKWAIHNYYNESLSAYNGNPSIVCTAMELNKLKILKWLYRIYDRKFNERYFYTAIKHNHISIIKWAMRHNCIFTTQYITSLGFIRPKILKLINNKKVGL